MTTDQIIEMLTRRAHRTSPVVPIRKLALALGAGVPVAFATMIAISGFRPGIAAALLGYPMLVKWLYAAALAGAAIATVATCARPGARTMRLAPALVGCVAVLAGTAAGELARTPANLRLAAVMGSSWEACGTMIVLVSLPVFAAVMLVLRRLAPTDLRIAGGSAGLLAGAVGAAVYALSCSEPSAAFVLAWYSGGIAMLAALGAITGPVLLRW